MSEQLDRLKAAIKDRYVLQEEVGSGGMATVYAADDLRHGRKVAVKVLRPELAATMGSERFLREIQVAAQLQHPNILPLLDSGEADGFLYYVMPLVDGPSLRDRLAHQGELPINDAVRILVEVVDALAAAHAKGIVHRDIKPDNVLLTGRHALVTDFGVAKAVNEATGRQKMTTAGVALGTPAYMSPEQAAADPSVDHRADIYAVGVMAYEMLTGGPPFAGASAQAVLAAHMTMSPPSLCARRASISPALEQVVLKCLAKRPADRWQSAEELLHQIEPLVTPSGGTTPTATQPTGAFAADRAPSRALVWGGVAVLLVLAVGGTWLATRSRAAGGASAVQSLAVLPCENGGDTTNAYFADGMTEELTTALARIPGINVAAHSSAGALKGKSVQDAGAKLHVGAVLECTVRRANTQLRVTASLVSVADERILWSSSYDKAAKDVFAVQDSISTAIAGALRVTLTPQTQTRIAARSTTNLEAHDLVLRGRYLLDQYTEKSLRDAVGLFGQAIRLDSSYADAWAGLGDAWGRLTDDWVAPKEGAPRQRTAALRALMLDSTSADAHTQLASVFLWYDRRFAEAEREYLRALALDSANVTAGVWYPYLLLATHRPDSAFAVLARAMRLNPLSYTVLSRAVNVNTQYGRADSAAALCPRLGELGPGGAEMCIGLVLQWRGKYAEALPYWRKILPASPTGTERARWARLLALAGQTAEARRELALAEAYTRDHYTREETIAAAHLALGDKDAAIAWLERLLASDGSHMAVLNVDSVFAPLRSDPRFQSLVKRAGLP